jgi:hypothetical protein
MLVISVKSNVVCLPLSHDTTEMHAFANAVSNSAIPTWKTANSAQSSPTAVVSLNNPIKLM